MHSEGDHQSLLEVASQIRAWSPPSLLNKFSKPTCTCRSEWEYSLGIFVSIRPADTPEHLWRGAGMKSPYEDCRRHFVLLSVVVHQSYAGHSAAGLTLLRKVYVQYLGQTYFPNFSQHSVCSLQGSTSHQVLSSDRATQLTFVDNFLFKVYKSGCIFIDKLWDPWTQIKLCFESRIGIHAGLWSFFSKYPPSRNYFHGARDHRFIATLIWSVSRTTASGVSEVL